MNFEKYLRFYTVFVIVVLLLTTFLCVCFVVVLRANENLGSQQARIALESCTQIKLLYC